MEQCKIAGTISKAAIAQRTLIDTLESAKTRRGKHSTFPEPADSEPTEMMDHRTDTPDVVTRRTDEADQGDLWILSEHPQPRGFRDNFLDPGPTVHPIGVERLQLNIECEVGGDGVPAIRGLGCPCHNVAIVPQVYGCFTDDPMPDRVFISDPVERLPAHQCAVDIEIASRYRLISVCQQVGCALNAAWSWVPIPPKMGR